MALKKIPATLLLSYQIEYENTDITIDELCSKYDVTTKQLKGYTKWSKKTSETNELPELIEPSKPIVTKKPADITIVNDKEQVLSDIDEFKRLAVAHAVKFIKDDAEFAEVKEFKDMVAIVDSIEKSYKDTKEQGPTINIAIQNLVERFKDDC